jgi:CubicO group peptidase (beta-lactamase class C family)
MRWRLHSFKGGKGRKGSQEQKERYSNGGYLIVQQLLEDVLGKPFPEVMQETVFGAIGMTSSTFEQSLPEGLEDRAATAHGWDVDAWRENPGQPAPGKWHSQDMASGGLWTTSSDQSPVGPILQHTDHPHGFERTGVEKSLLVRPGAGAVHANHPGCADRRLYLAGSMAIDVLGVAESRDCIKIQI